jgi:hypothetical protein
MGNVTERQKPYSIGLWVIWVISYYEERINCILVSANVYGRGNLTIVEESLF